MCLRPQVMVELLATSHSATDANTPHDGRPSFFGELPFFAMQEYWLVCGMHQPMATHQTSNFGTRMGLQKIQFAEKHVEGRQ